MYTNGKLTFLAMERTASRAVRNAFIDRGATQIAPHHEGPAQGHEIQGVPFTVVRNHWDLVVSHWYNARMNERRNEPIPYTWLAYHFLDNRALWPAGGPCFRFAQIEGVRLLRYENLQDDLDELFQEFGIDPVSLPLVGQSEEREGRHYRSYFNGMSAAFVGWSFRPEIERLGFRFDGPPGHT